MYTVKIAVSPIRDGEVVSGTIQTQRKRPGGQWVAEGNVTVVSGQPGDDRTIPLEDDQRLVVEMTSNMEMVVDREQATSYMRQKEPPKPTPPSRDGEEKDTPDIAANAQKGEELKRLQEQERRDQAVSAAREKAKEHDEKKEEHKGKK
jgi:hypothetical protein